MNATQLDKKDKALLHGNVCMISTHELLHIMSIDALVTVDLSGILDNHARAIAGISDAQIDAYIDVHKRRAANTGRHWGAEEIARLSHTAKQLRETRDDYASRVTVH